VSEALNIERNPEKIKPKVKEPTKNNEEREKRKKEMERRRNERRKGRELKRAVREKERIEINNKEERTLLEIAKEHRGHGIEESPVEKQSSISTASEDYEEWEDFQMGDSPPKMVGAKVRKIRCSTTSTGNLSF
jgi:hypothetical protein